MPLTVTITITIAIRHRSIENIRTTLRSIEYMPSPAPFQEINSVHIRYRGGLK
ncbi:hypothetical protein PtA15_6A430 [Puccinia triticina]|uniref:Uncharacterized protein n=1 Tax=Puccinia triticina TaxID=208348 RepID=A0ABY7CKP2_9BASI|nr:uncharacterized protein PtA15_6A430 [Puccinia triticina]WAQ85801.1 hypothetical protein PtA15_6A430 [Puccinia triticina]WAR55687.1 hypothetical protein PtB15_6B430 [Puccinia triticina]